MQRIYIDSSILIDRITGSAPERQNANQILIKIKKQYNERYIPQTVIGEVFIKILEKSRDVSTDTKTFVELIQDMINIRTQSPTLRRDVLSVALEIQAEDEHKIGYCDAILVSHAICSDSDCCVFIIDAPLHRSHKIITKLNECKSSGHIVKLIDSV